MGIISDIREALKEIPLSDILRERLITAERAIEKLEKENINLKQENTRLEKENSELKEIVDNQGKAIETQGKTIKGIETIVASQGEDLERLKRLYNATLEPFLRGK